MLCFEATDCYLIGNGGWEVAEINFFSAYERIRYKCGRGAAFSDLIPRRI